MSPRYLPPERARQSCLIVQSCTLSADCADCSIGKHGKSTIVPVIPRATSTAGKNGNRRGTSHPLSVARDGRKTFPAGAPEGVRLSPLRQQLSPTLDVLLDLRDERLDAVELLLLA